jgi:hypothetical protein
MKQLFLYIAIMLILAACNNEAAKEDTDTGGATATTEQQWFATDTVIVWDCNAADKERKKIYIPADSVPMVEPLLNGINKTYNEVKLNADHTSGDTLYVSIPEADWIANRSGTSFADQYFSFAALNLLELKGIKHVNFVLKAGSHAGPHTWSITDFAGWKTDTTSAK